MPRFRLAPAPASFGTPGFRNGPTASLLCKYAADTGVGRTSGSEEAKVVAERRASLRPAAERVRQYQPLIANFRLP